MRIWIWLAGVSTLLYLGFWPTPIEPTDWQAPINKGYVKEFSSNTQLQALELFQLDNTAGPEGLALGANGVIFISSAEGWILRHNPQTGISKRWVNTGGRPLGMAFDQHQNLLIADAYRGLLSITPSGTIDVLADTVNGVKISFADDVDVASDGRVYFSDASSKFGAQAYGGTYAASLLATMEHGGHGRVLVYNPTDRSTAVLLDGLNFANGVAVDAASRFLLVAETGHYRIKKYWLSGPNQGKTEILIDNLPGFPDNIVRGRNGRFWVGLVAPRNKLLDSMSNTPWLRKVVQRLPEPLRPKIVNHGHLFTIDGEGENINSLQDPSGSYHAVTGAIETQQWLYISSLLEDKLARLDRATLKL
ncbi:MAG: SMP-30/gluconolactonase/LRE family protein [Porticoccaceae bacterium]|nr:SMP-30/gluconolactonase/LRE family protein [Porticoccaceae bacterium]